MASFRELIEKNNLVLVDFSAEWCGPCQTLATILKDVKEHFGEGLSVIKIDVDKNNALARSFSVQGVPTLILYKSGQQVWRQSGLLTRTDLIAIIKQHTA
ncbi:MAG: thioredoxin family protein [Sphingobacterium composti]|uniref:thioredoxin family protein n=1 Tax=Sphingobacterium composti TaxID=363260 RepID=UPI00135CC0AB|nr:thioredoxin family protein [Sphingobacterium composti Ten et al. 2007 non Yoo et al. 2007]